MTKRTRMGTNCTFRRYRLRRRHLSPLPLLKGHPIKNGQNCQHNINSWSQDTPNQYHAHEIPLWRGESTRGCERLQLSWQLHPSKQQHRQINLGRQAFNRLINISKSVTLHTKTKLKNIYPRSIHY